MCLMDSQYSHKLALMLPCREIHRWQANAGPSNTEAEGFSEMGHTGGRPWRRDTGHGSRQELVEVD